MEPTSGAADPRPDIDGGHSRPSSPSNWAGCVWDTPLRVVRAGEVTTGTAQSDGMQRFEAISGKRLGATHLWMGRTHVAPASSSADHHHGESETAIYVAEGNPVFVFAVDGQEVRLHTEPGDFVWVPPYVPHREENPSDTEQAVVVIARSTQEAIVVNLPALVPPDR